MTLTLINILIFYFRCDEEITISYLPLITGEPQRSLHIQAEWCFECRCSRCQRQDEMSQITCPACENGSLIYSLTESKWTCPWICCKCHAKFEAECIQKIISQAENELK